MAENTQVSPSYAWFVIFQMQVDEVVILTPIGALTFGPEADLLREKITGLIYHGKTKIVLDCSRLSYINAGGIGELIQSFTDTKKAGGRICLLKLKSPVLEIAEISRLIKVFDCYQTEEEALASFN